MPRAPRRCPGDHYECPNLIEAGQKHCPDHTVNWRGPRTASSQATTTWQWQQVRDFILERDQHQCQIRYTDICTGQATTVDKKIPAARRPDLATNPANLRAACDPCQSHKGRTSDRQQ